MRLIPTRHLWGVAQPSSEALPRLAADGFAAVEPVAQWLTEAGIAEMRQLAAVHHLDLLPLVYTSGRTVAEHLAEFRRVLALAMTFAPIRINVHSGLDAWSRDEAMAFYREARAIAADLPVAVCHETHRGRTFYSPWITRDILLAVPGLRLTADFSHWVCVAERRILDEDPDLLAFVADQVSHIHARVGHSQGPQVPDPRAPEWQEDVLAHEGWWDVVWQRMAARGEEFCTMTPEFGPAPYLAQRPYTNMPMIDLWQICTWQMQRQMARFQTPTGSWHSTRLA